MRWIRFNQIHKPSGKRIRYEKVVPGIGAVEPDGGDKLKPLANTLGVALDPTPLADDKEFMVRSRTVAGGIADRLSGSLAVPPSLGHGVGVAPSLRVDGRSSSC